MDGDRSDLVECISGDDMVILNWPTLISLSRPVTIGQDEVETITCATRFSAVLKASELNNRPRLEPLFKERGFIEKFKQGSSVWISANNLRFSEKWNLQKWEPDPLNTRSNLFV